MNEQKENIPEVKKSSWWDNVWPIAVGLGLYLWLKASGIFAMIGYMIVYHKLNKKNKPLAIILGLITGVIVYFIFWEIMIYFFIDNP